MQYLRWCQYLKILKVRCTVFFPLHGYGMHFLWSVTLSISGYFWSTWEGLAAATDIHRCIIRNDQSSCWSPSPPLPHCKAVTERAALQVWHHAAAVIASSTCQTSKLKSTPNLKTFTWKPVIFLALIPNSTSLKVRRAHDYMSLSFSK